MITKEKRYFNRKQLETMFVAANEEYAVWSRGAGKSEGVDAPRLLRNVWAMPRSAGGIISPTYTKIKQNTLPAVASSLARMGYFRDIHYTLGVPPKEWPKPYIEPFTYDHVMSWCNGSIIHLLSFDRPMSANSLSLDYIMGFEAKFLKYDKLVNEVFPALRGNIHKFGDCPWHGGKVFSTDMPTQAAGMWILEKEKEMDTDLIDAIKDLVLARKNIRAFGDDLSSAKKSELKSIEKDLRIFRSNALLYTEADIIDNIDIIGEKRIKQFQRELPPLTFLTSIMNKRPKRIGNGFYSALNTNVHGYDPAYASFMESYDFDKTREIDCRHDADIVAGLPLCISNDCNSSINTMITAQVIGKELRTLRGSWVKTPKKLHELVQEWHEYYQYHTKREVIYFFDSTMVHTDARSNESYSDIVIHVLEANGWTVVPLYIGQPPRHDIKHGLIDRALKGDTEFLFPMFNNINCEYLLLAMSLAGIRYGKNGFEKDKRMEASDDTPDNPDEIKTHATDAWDTMFMGTNYNYPGLSSSFPVAQTW